MIEQVLAQGNESEIGKLIYDKVSKFKESQEYENMMLGQAYYDQRNTTIMSRTKEFFYAGRYVPDPYEVNHKVPSDYMRKLVKQKIAYSINDRLKIASEKQDLSKMWDDLGRDFIKKLKRYAAEMSKNTRAHFQAYIKDGKFKYNVIPSHEIIPGYEDEELDYVIRFYDEDNEHKAQLITQASISNWIMQGGTYVLVGEIKPTIVNKTLVDGRQIGATSNAWGKVPFTVTYNNDEKRNDLHPIRGSVDIYDIVNSDFANNLDSFQDVYWVLKDFQGENLDEFLRQIKQLKAIKVGEGGDARTETIQIPTEARKVLLEITEDNIYKFGMGLNTDKIGGGNITNVVIKSRYADLNLKANDFEEEMRDGIYQLLDLLNRYYEVTGQEQLELNEIRIAFDRSNIINEEELIKLSNESIGKVSEPTRLSYDPRVNDIEEEIKAMQEEQSKQLASMESAFGGGV